MSSHDANPTSSFLFYVVSDTNDVFPINLRWFLCGRQISVNCGGNGLETAAITNHLNECHHQLHNGLKKCFPKIGNFTHGIDLEILHPTKCEILTQPTINTLFNIQSTPRILNGERKRKGTKKTTQANSKSSEEQHVKSLSIPEALVVD